MKTEQDQTTDEARSARFRLKSRPRAARLLLLLTVALFAFTACVNDLNPSGGWSGVAQDEDFLYVGSKDGRVVRVQSSTGALDRTWVYPAEEDDDLGEIYGTPQISNGVVYGSSFRCRGNECDGQVYAVDIATGRSAWATGTVDIKTRLVGSIGVGESTVAVGTSAIGGNETPRGFLIGLDPTSDIDSEVGNRITNREKWRLPVNGAIWGGITVVNNIAYFGTLQSMLYAVDLSDDEKFSANPADRIQWQFKASGAIAGTPFVTDSAVYFGSFGDDVYALDLATRRQNPNSNTLNPSSEWSFDAGAWVWAEPLLQDGVVYIVTLPGEVFALDADNGQQRWSSPAKVGEEIVAQPAIFQSNRGPALAVASGEKDITIVALADGQIGGVFDTNNRGMKSSPVVGDNVIFVHTDSGQLRLYQPSTLSLLNCIEAKGEGKGCS